ncbi:uncharacterized protein LOC110651033 isoform X2 [Hevea brasiliensis]|uniref:uncharacterized protein LOC110651033 isoform X2 n=1 Tax=Hevea brasiliensis TaxID=3981 RepID=UPI0025F5F64C|nr:uncharacterized protein LOC110651033 isoform X2 [Hevea brasiliensis]
MIPHFLSRLRCLLQPWGDYESHRDRCAVVVVHEAYLSNYWSRHRAGASRDVNMGTPVPSEGGEPLTPQSQPLVQFNALVVSQEAAPVDGMEDAPGSLHESIVLNSQDSLPSSKVEIDSLGRQRLQLCDGNLLGGSTITRMITSTFKQWFDTEDVNWKAVSKETKEFYWEVLQRILRLPGN